MSGSDNIDKIMQYLGIFVFLLNLLGFAVIGYDKKQAKNKNWRVPEKNIFFLAFFGAAAGVFAGMMYFRHKTKHKVLYYGVLLFTFLNLLTAYYIVKALL